MRLINAALKRHFIFSSLDEDNSKPLIKAMLLHEVNAGETVHSHSNNFYIVATGKLEVIVNRRRASILKQGDSFGGLAVLQNLPRSAEVKTAELCQMWVIDRAGCSEALKIANLATYEENKEFIEGVVMFQVLTQAQRNGLIDSLTTLKYGSGSAIVNEGEIGELFYIIKEGTVSCCQQGQEIRRLSRGDFFGEQALIYSSTRTATCIAVGEVKCLSITRDKLTEALGASLQKIIYKNSLRIAFGKSQYLSQTSSAQQEQVINLMQVTTYAEHSVVIADGTRKGDTLWVVVKGALANEGNSSVLAGLYAVLGEREILGEGHGNYKGNVIAKEEADVAEITRTLLEHGMGATLEAAAASNILISILKKAEIFNGLSYESLQRLSGCLTQRSYRSFEVIFEQGSTDSNFYIIKEGTVDIIISGVKVRSITKLDYFGERSILSNTKRTASIVAKGNVTCWLLSRANFFSVVSPNVIDHLSARIDMQDESVSLDMLAPVQVIGRGNFGTVTLVVHKVNGTLYALKSVPRWKIVSYDIFESVVQEKAVLGLLNHIFILKCIRTFKDPHRVYYLTEYIRGVDLFDALRHIGLVSDDIAKFYTAELVLVLSHLHERRIAYRDLKPENILVDSLGFMKLVDFGTAKIVSTRTYTIVGTPHYMAPEVILGKGYDYYADYWSLGVMLYEFICGILPFGNDLRDPYEVYEAVLKMKLQYPKYLICPFESQSMIEQLLSKHPASRLGDSIHGLKSHSWFRGFDWGRLNSKETLPPFIPEVPDISMKIREAQQSKLKVHEFLVNVERDEDKSKMKRRPEPVNWDADF
jgi:cGMP-dependent protein kinase